MLSKLSSFHTPKSPSSPYTIKYMLLSIRNLLFVYAWCYCYFNFNSTLNCWKHKMASLTCAVYRCLHELKVMEKLIIKLSKCQLFTKQYIYTFLIYSFKHQAVWAFYFNVATCESKKKKIIMDTLKTSIFLLCKHKGTECTPKFLHVW